MSFGNGVNWSGARDDADKGTTAMFSATFTDGSKGTVKLDLSGRGLGFDIGRQLADKWNASETTPPTTVAVLFYDGWNRGGNVMIYDRGGLKIVAMDVTDSAGNTTALVADSPSGFGYGPSVEVATGLFASNLRPGRLDPIPY